MFRHAFVVSLVVAVMAVGHGAGAQAGPRPPEAVAASHRLQVGELVLDLRDALEPAHGVRHALVCVAELVPTPLAHWMVADDAGQLGAFNLPPRRLHLWIDQVGFVGRAIDVDVSTPRATAVRVQLTRFSNDRRKSPECPVVPPSTRGH